MGLSNLYLGACSLYFAGRHQLAGAVGGKRGRVGRLDDDLQVGIAGLDIIQSERVDRSLIGNQVQVGVDAFLGRMKKAVVSNRVDYPEVLISAVYLQNLLCRRKLDEGGVAHPGANAQDVVGMVLDQA